MDVLDLPIRLVVKAPNQQIDDQVIECAITWTVKKLKTYLSEVYPSNPKAEDQKLIYSGQLLPDNLMLKDILRQYDTEVVHTVHLVCMPPKDFVGVSSPTIPTPSPSTSTAFVRPEASTTSSNSEGIRHRMSTNNVNSEQRTQVQSNAQERQSVLPNTFGLQIPATPEQINQQLAWMHMYGQYMNFYMQQYQGVYPGINPVVPNVQQPVTANDAQPAEQVNPANVQERQVNEIRRMNAQGGPADDDDDEIGANRDWLDWVYVFSRLSVLFAIVYFYSSFNRFVMVVVFAVLIYLYQTGGFWRRDRMQRANNIRERNDRRPVENVQDVAQNVEDVAQNVIQEQPQEGRDLEQMQRETRELEETMDRDTETNNTVTQQTVSFLHIAWTFVATFFSSLLPQQQGAVNLN